jgi:hypothetical protein
MQARKACSNAARRRDLSSACGCRWIVDPTLGLDSRMIPFCDIHGAMVGVDAAGQATGCDDGFARNAPCKAHDPAARLAPTTSSRTSAGQPGASPATWPSC